jgi:hypothetical protein
MPMCGTPVLFQGIPRLTIVLTPSLSTRNIFAIMLMSALAVIFPVLLDAGVGGDFDVKTYLDRDSAGWTDKASDYAFLVERTGCRIKWNAVEDKTGRRWLEVRTDCEVPFAEQAPIHRAILHQIQARWPIRDFIYIGWGSFCNKVDWNWCVPIAAASLQDKEFIEHCRKYPRTETVSTNHIFIRLANQTHAYRELSDILKEFGVTVKLKMVQKVFSQKLKNSDFYDQLKGLKVKGNPRVIFDVGEAYFYIDR